MPKATQWAVPNKLEKNSLRALKHLYVSDLATKVGEIEKGLVHVSATLQKEAKTVASNALDLAKHPSRYAELGASLAEGMAGESLGEMLGAGLGTVFGPEGTVIGAEVGAWSVKFLELVRVAKLQKSWFTNLRPSIH